MKLDLHLHTRYSVDSLSNLKDIVRKCRELKIVPAITDHNTIGAHEPLRRMDFSFIPGEEIKTAEGDLIGLYLNEPIQKKTPFLEALDLIAGQGGLSCLPHMYDGMRHGVSESELAKRVDIVEVFNPRCTFGWQNGKARKFAQENRKLMGAGGDSHFVREIGNTYVEVPEIDVSGPKGLKKALEKGRIHGSRPGVSMRGATTAVKLAKKIFRI
ncbi:MAG: PHP domain-containing protein [Candidatus ainarchaeum sp.]|nr:PHP domain-containing protein [Candidatus ainarchaeum sp.]